MAVGLFLLLKEEVVVKRREERLEIRGGHRFLKKTPMLKKRVHSQCSQPSVHPMISNSRDFIVVFNQDQEPLA